MPFDAAAGMAYGPICLASREARKGPLDKMSAAYAKALKATLVTHNVKGSEKHPGIRIENWLDTVG